MGTVQLAQVRVASSWTKLIYWMPPSYALPQPPLGPTSYSSHFPDDQFHAGIDSFV